MTPIQADNWRQFADRMAWETHRWRTPARRERMLEIVRNAIDVHINNYGLAAIVDWDSGSYPCDDFDRLLADWGLSHWDERACCERETDFASHVMCCIRAGFDVAVQPSAGVVGARFTVGMLRRMFPEGLPPYVDDFFHGPGSNSDAPHLSTLSNAVRVWL